MEHEQTSSGIASAVQLNDSDIILFVQRDGTFQAYLPSMGIIMTMQDITRYHDIGYLTDMDMVNGNIFTSYHNISRVVHFSTSLDITLEEQVSIELPREGTTYFNNSASACLIKDLNPANDYSRITLYSLESESVIAEYEFDTSLEAHFLGDETEFFSIQCFDFCNIYRIADGSLVKSFAREDGYTTNLTHDYITYTADKVAGNSTNTSAEVKLRESLAIKGDKNLTTYVNPEIDSKDPSAIEVTVAGRITGCKLD